MERSLGGCEGGLAAGGAGRAPRPCLGPGDGLGCGKHPWGSGPFGRWPAQSQRRLATPPRSGGESRCPTGGAGEGGALEHPPPPAAVGPGRLSSPGRLRLPRAPLGPARTRVLGSAPALALRALGAGMPGGRGLPAPALPRQQCSGPRALRRLERRAGVVGGAAGAGARSGEAGRAARGRLSHLLPSALPWRLPGQPPLACRRLRSSSYRPEPSCARAASCENSNPAPATAPPPQTGPERAHFDFQNSPGFLHQAFLSLAFHPELSRSQRLLQLTVGPEEEKVTPFVPCHTPLLLTNSLFHRTLSRTKSKYQQKEI